MMTLKAIRADGTETLFEAKTFSYNPGNDCIDAIDNDGPYTLYLKEHHTDMVSHERVFAMNASGATVGNYRAKHLKHVSY